MSRRSSAGLATGLSKFFAHARLSEVPDPRKARGKRYSQATMLRTLLTSLVCGRTGLQATERLSDKLSKSARCLLRIPQRISDTALRYWLNKCDHNALRKLLHRCVKQARTSNSICNDAFPWGTVAMDGRQNHTPLHDKTLTQRRKGKASLRTITTCLISSKLKPCLDTALQVPQQNENSAFETVFADLCKHFGRWFQLLTYDAGACSKANAALADKAKRGYVFALKKTNQPCLKKRNGY